jgi:hypothetical protein
MVAKDEPHATRGRPAGLDVGRRRDRGGDLPAGARRNVGVGPERREALGLERGGRLLARPGRGGLVGGAASGGTRDAIGRVAATGRKTG